jgi:hypothetical protein
MDQAGRLREALQMKPTTGQIAVMPNGIDITRNIYSLYYYMRTPLTLEIYS